MEHGFWHDRWRHGRIGFHENRANPHLVAHWAGLGVASQGRVLVPLCGKSLDLRYLHGLGHEVVGVELSPMACEAFFVENELACETKVRGAYMAFIGTGAARGITILCGDFFLLDAQISGVFDAFYDRAAIIALPAQMRASHVQTSARLVKAGGRGLLTTITYPPAEKDGPPFPIDSDEVARRFGDHFAVASLSEHDAGAEGQTRWGLSWLKEHQFALTRR